LRAFYKTNLTTSDLIAGSHNDFDKLLCVCRYKLHISCTLTEAHYNSVYNWTRCH